MLLERTAAGESNGFSALALELTALIPIAVAMAFHQAWPTPDISRLFIGMLTIGLVSAAALLLYLRASERLPFGLFGLLTYVEPVLLAAVSIAVLGESLTSIDILIYGPIVLALCLLGFENIAALRRPATPPP